MEGRNDAKGKSCIVFVPLVSIAYIAVSVYFYGKGMAKLFIALWLPLVAFNTWAIASGRVKMQDVESIGS